MQQLGYHLHDIKRRDLKESLTLFVKTVEKLCMLVQYLVMRDLEAGRNTQN